MSTSPRQRRVTILAWVALLGLLCFHVWALSRPWLHEVDPLFTWRKGPLVAEASPYSAHHAARYLWPAVVGMLDLYLASMLAWFAVSKRMNSSVARGLGPAVAMVVFTVVLTAGELGVRVAIHHFQFTQYHPDPELFWYNRPLLRDHSDVTDGALRSTNSRGFRGTEEIQGPKVEGELRIFLVGDSSTFGLGVEDQQTYGAVLERRLSEWTGRSVTVVNTASPGHTSYQGWILWQRWVDLVDPDILIWAYNNDPCLDMVPEEERLARRPSLRVVERVLFRSDLYLMAREVLLGVARRSDRARFAQTSPTEAEGWVPRIPFDDYHGFLEDFEDAAARRCARAVFVRMPLNRASILDHPIYATSFDDRYRDHLSDEFCVQPGRHCANLESIFDGLGGADLFLPHHLFHPSAKGHEIIGKVLTRTIVDRGLLEPQTPPCGVAD